MVVVAKTTVHTPEPSQILMLRKKHWGTQAALAEEIYVDRSTVSLWETGSLVMSPRLAKLFLMIVEEKRRAA